MINFSSILENNGSTEIIDSNAILWLNIRRQFFKVRLKINFRLANSLPSLLKIPGGPKLARAALSRLLFVSRPRSPNSRCQFHDEFTRHVSVLANPFYDEYSHH